MKIVKVMLIIIGILFLLNVTVFIYISSFGKTITQNKEVKCYDRYSNEIIGEKCIDKEYHLIEPYSSIAFYAFLGILISFISLIALVIGNHIKESSS